MPAEVRCDDNGAIWAPECPDYEAFFNAVSTGNSADVKTALNSNIEIDALQGDGGDGKTALHLASAAGYVNIVEYLIASGAVVDIHDRSQHGPSTPLHDAAFFGRCRVVEVLLDNGADIKAVGEQDGTVLQQVLRSKKHVEPQHIETIILLLDRGHDIHSGSMELGGTVLHQAAELGSIELIQILLDRGADVNINSSNCPGSVLKTVAAYGTCDTAKFLIEQGATVDRKDLSSANSTDMIDLLISHNNLSGVSDCGALHAKCSGPISLLTHLLDKDFDIEAIDGLGDTPLLSACGSNYPSSEIVALLLRNGADVKARSASAYCSSVVKGDTPLHRAAWRSNPEIVRLLLRAGANLTMKNDEGQTPLIKFASSLNRVCVYNADAEDLDPRVQVLWMLITADADVDAVDAKHQTALHAVALCSEDYTKQPRRIEAAKLLLAAGLALEAADSDGRTALDIFIKQEDYEMVGLLSSYIHG